jgi:DNA topoisomerase-6 subunit B
MASVWVPFTSESKEAIADYDEIRKEMKLALQECGRKLGIYLRRRKRMRREAERRTVFERYIGEIATGCEAITGDDAKRIYEALLKQAKRKTEEADYELDEDGNVIDDGGRLAADDGVVIIEDRQTAINGNGDDERSSDEDTLFGNGATKTQVRKKRSKKKRASKRNSRKR